MDKPRSMSVKDYLIKKMSVRHNIPAARIEQIINFQFDRIREATKTCNSIEISGFGKFMFNRTKAVKYKEKQISKINLFTEKANDPNITPEKRQSYLNRVANAVIALNNIKTKLNEQDNGISETNT